MNFELIFIDDKNTEHKFIPLSEKAATEYPAGTLAGLSLSINNKAENEISLVIENNTEDIITGFAGIKFKWEEYEKGFTLIPGIYYNGNYNDDIFDIPHINMPEKPYFEASLSAASIPKVFIFDGESKGYCFEPSIESAAGYNGVKLDALNKTITFFMPAYEQKVYRHKKYSGKRKPFIYHPREILRFKLKKSTFNCESIIDLYKYAFENGRKVAFYNSFNEPRVPEKAAAEKVREWIYNKHAVHSSIGTPMFLNAFTKPESSYPYGGYAEWNIQIGWCSGTMTAFPMLKFGGKYRDFAIEYLDFLSKNGDSPSGVKRSIYDGEKWVDRNHKEFEKQYEHLRFYSEYIYYLGKCISLEKEKGIIHPNWEKDFNKGIEIIASLWEREKDFGHYWDTQSPILKLKTKGTAAGAYCLLALSEGLLLDQLNIRLNKILFEASNEYYERCTLKGRCNAGPADILKADDSESAAALTNAYVNAYLITKNEKYKEMAINTAYLFASWVLCYNARFPAGSMLEGINVCGGVLANVQNRHIGPGICTNSAKFLKDLAVITEDKRFEELYLMVKAAAVNCVCMYDGEFYGNTFDKRFLEGMVTEQINLTDALGQPGETWCVSASWPATAVLLGYTDQ